MTFVPVFVHHQPSRCPACDKTENRTEICGHCGYEYERTNGVKSFLIGTAIIAGILILTVVTGLAIDSGMCWVDNHLPSECRVYGYEYGRITLGRCMECTRTRVMEPLSRIW